MGYPARICNRCRKVICFFPRVGNLAGDLWKEIKHLLVRALTAFLDLPLNTLIGTLDALHLATLVLAQQGLDLEFTLLTHDEQLARIALACGVDGF